ncbi:MAG TPA: hypothetical protein VHE58_01895 [Burkholderiales bacterium]|nr:hypothetical protein [Burkholderiales bacterium]
MLMKPRKLLTMLLGSTLLAGCYSSPYYNPAKHHHTPEALDQPPRDLIKARLEAGLTAERFFVVKHGETRELSGLIKP